MNKFQLSILLFLITIPWITPDSAAKCVIHIVKENETLGLISNQYYDTPDKWRNIKWQNNLRSNKIEVNQELEIHIPDHDWIDACRDLIRQRLHRVKRIDQLELLTENIPSGIILVTTVDEHIQATNTEKLEMCRWAIATAEQESNFEFAVGGAGEIGMYQFKLDTARLTLKWYGINLEQDDKSLVKMLLDEDSATWMFVLHYHYLIKRYGSMWIAWKHYNNGSEASAYASKVVERYWQIRSLKYTGCKINAQE